MPAVKKTARRRRLLAHSARRIALWAAPLAVIAGSAAIGVTPLGRNALQRGTDGVLGVTAAMGFVVTDIEVEGRDVTDPATIMAALGAARGTPIFAISPSRAKDKLQSLPWVRGAAVERRLPHTLFIRLTERKPLALWQHAGKQELIDHEGAVIAVTDLSPFAHLPIVVGDGAAQHARALLDMLRTQPALATRVSAAIWVGGRRWTLRIDRLIDIYLPEEDAPEAWAHLAELERSDNLLQRDVRAIDMRLPDRLVIRTNAAPPREMPKKPRTAGKSA